jgi:hypothetical protein
LIAQRTNLKDEDAKEADVKETENCQAEQRRVLEVGSWCVTREASYEKR